MEEEAFRTAIETLCTRMELEGISTSAGFSRRCAGCSLKEQLDEADSRMYQDKKRFYRVRSQNQQKHA